MLMSTERSVWTSWSMIAIGAVLSTAIAARSWVGVKLHKDRTIEVTGSAKRRIVSDLIKWSAVISTENRDRTAAYKALHEHVDRTIAYLKAQHIAAADIRVSSAATQATYDTSYKGVGAERIEQRVFIGWKTTQTISVSSRDVANVERVSREVTQLIESGVPITSEEPSYFYTQLGAVKIEMLAEAAHDARTRAQRMLSAAGGASLGPLRQADMGVININPANSTGVSAEGNNDTTSLEKDILTIVHCTYELER
jgi:hypothetical protein